MKKLQKSSELLWLFGNIFVALGVTICSKADLGVSMIAAPAFVVCDAVAPIWSGISVGMAEYIIQGILLILLCIIVRRFDWRYLLAFGVAVIYGYTLNLFLWVFKGVVFSQIWLRWIMLIVGDIITALGVACFFRTYLPLQVYELFVSEISLRLHFNINKTKSVFDISLLVISIVLAISLFGDISTFDWSGIGYKSFHSIGLGTLVTALINSPIIATMGKLLDALFDNSPRFTKMAKYLKR